MKIRHEKKIVKKKKKVFVGEESEQSEDWMKEKRQKRT